MNKMLSCNNLLFIRPINNKWEVEYESYFNPHATPKQLMDTKIFDTFDEAFDWSNNYLKDYLECDDFIIADVSTNYSISSLVMEDWIYRD